MKLKTPFRVLQVFSTLDVGGAETMMMNVYRNVNRAEIQFDFVVNDGNRQYAFEPEVLALGGRIYRVPRFRAHNLSSYAQSWRQLLRSHPEWRIVHGHYTTPASVYLGISKQLGRIAIAHSHSAPPRYSVDAIARRILRHGLTSKADFLFACSQEAGAYMFRKKKEDVVLFWNAIDVERFVYDARARVRVRQELGLGDALVVGHISRFSREKNCGFLLKVFRALLRERKDAKLLLVGKHENDPGIKRQVELMGLEQQVVFTGVRLDIPELLSAMDVFVLPSLFEGLPLVLVEAQASGLPCVVSDTVTKQVDVTGLVRFVPLRKSPDYWASMLLECGSSWVRPNTSHDLRRGGFDVKSNAQWLQRFYLDVLSNARSSVPRVV